MKKNILLLIFAGLAGLTSAAFLIKIIVFSSKKNNLLKILSRLFASVIHRNNEKLLIELSDLALNIHKIIGIEIKSDKINYSNNKFLYSEESRYAIEPLIYKNKKLGVLKIYF